MPESFHTSRSTLERAGTPHERRLHTPPLLPQEENLFSVKELLTLESTGRAGHVSVMPEISRPRAGYAFLGNHGPMPPTGKTSA